MSSFLRGIADLIPRALALLTRDPQPIKVSVGRWRGVFSNSKEEKELFVYAISSLQARSIFEQVKEIRIREGIGGSRPINIPWDFNSERAQLYENDAIWTLILVEPDSTDWKPKLVSDYYQPEKRAG